MNGQRSIFFYGGVTFTLAIWCCLNSFVQIGEPISIYSSDSSFSVNNANGWSSLNSYLSTEGDSVIFEVILQHNLPSDSLFWNNRNEIGTISTAFIPEFNQVILYKEGIRTWELSINTEGICSLLLLIGPVPKNDPVIIPIKTRYKK